MRTPAIALLLVALPAAPASHPPAAVDVPCRIVWDGATSGGDTQTAHADLKLTRSAPQADGSFIMFGGGDATVTYVSGLAGHRVTSGSPFTAKLDVTLTSEDGKTATVDIGAAPDEGVHQVVVDPGGFTYDEEVETFRAITIPLQDGVTTPYSESYGSGKMKHSKTGTITLHYCTGSTPSGPR